MRKLDAQHIKNDVVKKLAVGKSQTSIAEQVGVDQSTISRFAKKGEIRQLIEEKREKLVKEVLPDAFQNVKSLVEGMKDVPEIDIKKLELCYKATRDTLKATVASFLLHSLHITSTTTTVSRLRIILVQ